MDSSGLRSKLHLSFAIFLLLAVPARSEEVFRIQVGGDYQRYSHSDLQRRVWELERAVSQLQNRVFQLEASAKPSGSGDTWLCTVTAMGDTFTGTGGSKAVAQAEAIKSCKNARNGDGFFCAVKKCEQ